MSDLCEGRVCVVTGAARGIGRAHVDALVAAGARVVVNDLDRAAVDETVAALTGAGGDAVGHVGDVSSAPGADGLLGTALDTWGRLDVVVNKAGIARDRMLVNLSEDDWDQVLQVHLKSTFLVTRGRPGTGAHRPRPARPSTPGWSTPCRRSACTATWASPYRSTPVAGASRSAGVDL